MKSLYTLCIAIMFVITICGCRNKYADKMQLVEDYLNNGLSISCTVTDCDFQQYTEGITGGLFIYDFECRDESGKKFTASYQRYADLTAETISHLIVNKEK